MDKFGLPSRIRIDKGVENVTTIAQFMLEKRAIIGYNLLALRDSGPNKLVSELTVKRELQPYYNPRAAAISWSNLTLLIQCMVNKL